LTRWCKDYGPCGGLRYPTEECVPCICLKNNLTVGSLPRLRRQSAVEADTDLFIEAWSGQIHLHDMAGIGNGETRRRWLLANTLYKDATVPRIFFQLRSRLRRKKPCGSTVSRLGELYARLNAKSANTYL
jgi:hypothetical protein